MQQRWVATRFGAGLDALRFEEFELPPPAPGEVTIGVRAAGVNPIDAKILDRLDDASLLPFPLGYECSGTIEALGEDAILATGGGAIGDEVLAFRVSGAYATRVNVPARDVFAKPSTVPFDEAAGLLLAGATAAEMLHRVRVTPGDTVLLHGASGPVGVSVLQQAARLGARVIGTASAQRTDVVRWFGGEPIPYGDGLVDRVRALAPGGIDAALDAAGTDEAIDASLALVADRSRILTIVRHDRATNDGLVSIGGAQPESARFRDAVRGELVALAGAGALTVPIARAVPLERADEALALVASGRAGGKVVLRP